jgi:thermostable 8-oxoguanine DNA glycosylase
LSPRQFRTLLTRLNGVGLKTASWVVRNLTRSDEIAIIDIHIRRAGVAAGVFDPDWVLPRDYLLFEEAFCAWAAAGGVRTADLDLCVWSTLARLGTTARLIFGVERLADLD